VTWIDVGGIAEVGRRRKFVFEHDGTPIVVFAHNGRFYALDNICIHKQRELVKGVILHDRVICPGHQWAYHLETGWEAKMQRCQPTYDVRVTGDRVEVDVASRRVFETAPGAPPSREQREGGRSSVAVDGE
jgi:nitrite reductase (NADH) small subunit